MKLNEIELITIGDSFSIESVKKFLDRATPNGMIDEFIVHYIEFGDHRGVILTDLENNIAAYAGFISRLNGKVWQAKHAVSSPPFKGRQLVGRLYKFVKESIGKSIQSDTEQTASGMRLWTKILPALGTAPMIYDTKSGHIIDPHKTRVNMYPQHGSPDEHRYTWILERNDRYPEQNRLIEGSLLIPYQNIWYNKGIKE